MGKCLIQTHARRTGVFCQKEHDTRLKIYKNWANQSKVLASSTRVMRSYYCKNVARRSGPNWVYIWKVIARKLCNHALLIKFEIEAKAKFSSGTMFILGAPSDSWIICGHTSQTHARACEWNGKEKWKERNRSRTNWVSRIALIELNLPALHFICTLSQKELHNYSCQRYMS